MRGRQRHNAALIAGAAEPGARCGLRRRFVRLRIRAFPPPPEGGTDGRARAFRSPMPRRSLLRLYRDEFRGYDRRTFQQDLLAGLTVAAVALPLALAFGVASGATPAAGLVTAVLSGLVIGALSGAPYQISGPTGAMSAILITLSHQYGISGVWVAGLMSGVFLILIGLLRLGRFIAFIPAPVITGFTSGIALIIFIGQIDGFLGVSGSGGESAMGTIVHYVTKAVRPDLRAAALGTVVIATMLLWPKRLNARFPASLLGIILATGLNAILRWPVPEIGDIPRTLLLSDRLAFDAIPFDRWTDFLSPALTITALGAIESLLCGTVGSNMTGIRLQANQELLAQGIGNVLIPFFGGVPATAAIARSSVGIKSGGRTRLVSIVHAIGLLASMFALAPVMARIPLASLSGVLMVTAFRMNEWESIRFIFGRRFKTASIAFLATMAAVVVLDLTQAILIGSFLGAAFFLSQIARLDVELKRVDPDKLRARGIEAAAGCPHVKVAYVTGPVFFAAIGFFNEAFVRLEGTSTLILSMRGVPLIDTAGLEAIERLREALAHRGGRLLFAGVPERVLRNLERSGLVDKVGRDAFYWSADQAIVGAGQRPCPFCG